MQHTTDNGTSGGTSKGPKGAQGGEAVDAVKERARGMVDRFTQRTSTALTRSFDFIQDHPIASVGLSLGLGFYSRTLFRLGLLAGIGVLVARVWPRLVRSSRARTAT